MFIIDNKLHMLFYTEEGDVQVGDVNNVMKPEVSPSPRVTQGMRPLYARIEMKK